ncbi:MAG: MBL fold metallo-hydrolase [Candidatus Helarchaeota archaeon]
MPSKVLLVKVLKPGLLLRDEKGAILDARSTVTLIQTEQHNILVDTSLKKDKKAVLQGLREQKLTREDIEIIINTHSHNDHTQNNKLFPSAKVYIHYQGRSFPNTMKIREFPFRLEDNIEIIETPGHSWDSITVVAKKDKIYAITGDAIPIKGNYDNWIPPMVHVDVEVALTSMQRIKEIADIIIPGHGVPFEVKK